MMYVGRVSVAKTACDEKGRPNTVPGPQYPPSNDSSMPSFLVALRYEMKFLHLKNRCIRLHRPSGAHSHRPRPVVLLPFPAANITFILRPSFLR